MSKLKTLFTLNEFNELYHKKNLSIRQISEKYKTYPNRVRRLAQKLGASLRTKSEAQKNALQTGRQLHPTEGKVRSNQTKTKISETVANNWDKMSKKEKNRRSQLAKQQWDNMTNEQKQEFHEKAHISIRQAAKYGSKLETTLLECLINDGYQVTFHQQHIIGNEKMHLDIVIPKLHTAIEIDGPSHTSPIWGQEKLQKSIEADNKKNGLLLGAGFCVIRIFQKKDVTQKLIRDILTSLLPILKQIDKKFPSPGNRLFVIGETDANSK